MKPTQTPSYPYVLITPARNEARFLENTIQSVAQQTELPSRWVIVNDGSTDDTAAIVARYAAKYDWIEIVDLAPGEDRNFAAKVYAFKAGQERLTWHRLRDYWKSRCGRVAGSGSF